MRQPGNYGDIPVQCCYVSELQEHAEPPTGPLRRHASRYRLPLRRLGLRYRLHVAPQRHRRRFRRAGPPPNRKNPRVLAVAKLMMAQGSDLTSRPLKAEASRLPARTSGAADEYARGQDTWPQKVIYCN